MMSLRGIINFVLLAAFAYAAYCGYQYFQIRSAILEEIKGKPGVRKMELTPKILIASSTKLHFPEELTGLSAGMPRPNTLNVSKSMLELMIALSLTY